MGIILCTFHSSGMEHECKQEESMSVIGSSKEVQQCLSNLGDVLSHPGAFDMSRAHKASRKSEEFNTILLNCEDGVGSFLKGGRVKLLLVKVELKKLLKTSVLWVGSKITSELWIMVPTEDL